MVARYSAFGFSIESAIELSELGHDSESNAPGWRIQTESDPVPTDFCVPIGTDTVYEGVEVRAYATTSGLRLRFDDTGTFDVRPAERVIAWYPGPGATNVAARADLLGRVLALVAHADGHVSLHASAVSIDGRGIAFLGPKHAGKSTLALALVRKGARLLTDDTLVVRMDDHGAAWAAPGVQRIRLWRDSARALDAESSSEPGPKPTIDCLTQRELQAASVPLDACYVLHGSGSVADATSAERELMTPVHAAVACIRFSKLGSLLGGREGAVVLDRVARLTRVVPVLAASVYRDLTRLDDVAATFMAWHRSGDVPDSVVAG